MSRAADTCHAPRISTTPKVQSVIVARSSEGTILRTSWDPSTGKTVVDIRSGREMTIIKDALVRARAGRRNLIRELRRDGGVGHAGVSETSVFWRKAKVCATLRG